TLTAGGSSSRCCTSRCSSRSSRAPSGRRSEAAPCPPPPRFPDLDQGFLDRGVEVAGPDGLEEAAADLELLQPALILLAEPPAGDEQDRDVLVHRPEALRELPAVHAGHAEVRDRKSTRLNSSHEWTS